MPSLVDGWLFILLDINQGTVVAIVDLDLDYSIIIADHCLIRRMRIQMMLTFRMPDLGHDSFNLSMTIERNRKYHIIDICHHSYIWMLFGKFSKNESRPDAKPLLRNVHKRKPDKEVNDPTINLSLTESLKCAMTVTFRNITYAIAVLSRCNQDLCNKYMAAIKRIFRYLNGAKNWHPRYRGATEEVLGSAIWGVLGGPLVAPIRAAPGGALLRVCGGALWCYVNYDHAGYHNDYKSRNRPVITFRGAVNRGSRKQKFTAQSTTDAK